MRPPHWNTVIEWIEERTRGDLSTLLVGIDPDTHNTSICCVEFDHLTRNYRLLHAQVVKVPRKFVGAQSVCAMADVFAFLGSCPIPDGVFVEDQLVRASGKGRTKNPQNLIPLAQVAGAALTLSPKVPKSLVQAHDWKGSVGKIPNQKRTCETLGLEYTVKETKSGGYCIPSVEPYECYAVEDGGLRSAIRPADWQHLLDAAGIAIWAHKKLIVQRAKVKARRSRTGL